MMVLVRAWVFGSAEAGWWFMFIQAITVFLALVGTTLSCISTGARVTYAIGRDNEVPSHFGMLHGKNLTPHRAIWTLATVSTAVGIFAVLMYLCGPAASEAMNTALTDAQKGSLWYPSLLMFSMETAKSLPNSLLIVTLVSNFGTFLLYMLTCVIAIVAFREHHSFSGFKHVVVPVFGVVANLICMLFYLVGPFMITGMSKLEPYVALGVAAVWGLRWGRCKLRSRPPRRRRRRQPLRPPRQRQPPPRPPQPQRRLQRFSTSIRRARPIFRPCPELVRRAPPTSSRTGRTRARTNSSRRRLFRRAFTPRSKARSSPGSIEAARRGLPSAPLGSPRTRSNALGACGVHLARGMW